MTKSVFDSDSLPETVLDCYPVDAAKQTADMILVHLASADLAENLYEDYQIFFCMPGLLYALKTSESYRAIAIFQRWLINPLAPGAILKSDMFNKYTRCFMQHVPVIFDYEAKNDTQYKITVVKFFLCLLRPEISEQLAVIEPETRIVALSAINQCLANEVSEAVRDSLASCFSEVILQGGIPVDDARSLLNVFTEIVISSEAGNHWHTLFDNLSMKFFSFDSSDHNWTSLILLFLLKKAREMSASTEYRQFFSSCFIRLYDELLSKRVVRTDGLLPKIPTEPFLRLFGEAAFIDTRHVTSVHLTALFGLFAYGSFSDAWAETLVQFVSSLLKGSFDSIMDVLNTIGELSSEQPALIGRLLRTLLDAAMEVESPDNMDSGTSKLKGCQWIEVMYNLVQHTFVEQAKEASDDVRAIVRKFCSAITPYELPPYSLMQVLFLLVTASDGETFCKIVRGFQSLQPNVMSDVITMVAIAPTIRPKVLGTMVSSDMFDCVLAYLEERPNDIQLIEKFMIAVVEVYKRTTLFSRRFIAKFLVFLQNVDSELAYFARNNIIYPSISAHKKHSSGKGIWFDRNFIQFIEGAEDEISVCVRGGFGISGFSIKEMKNVPQDLPENLKPHFLTKADIAKCVYDYPFTPYVPPQQVSNYDKASGLLVDLGLSERVRDWIDVSPEKLSEFDKMCKKPEYTVSIRGNDCALYRRFKEDIGSYYDMSICRLNFIEGASSDVEVIFNETDLCVSKVETTASIAISVAANRAAAIAGQPTYKIKYMVLENDIIGPYRCHNSRAIAPSILSSSIAATTYFFLIKSNKLRSLIISDIARRAEMLQLL